MSSLSEQISELQRTATYQRYRADYLRSDVICLQKEIADLKKALAELLQASYNDAVDDQYRTRWHNAMLQAERLLGRKEGT